MAQLDETANGRLTFASNELLIDSKVEDPAACRLASVPEQKSLGKFSGSIIEPEGGYHEVAMMQVKQTEDFRRGGEISFGVTKPGMGSTDDAMVEAMVLNYEGGFEFKLPVKTPHSQPGQIKSIGGQYTLAVQDDGNLVMYRNQPGGWKPVWSIFTGMIG